MSAEKIPVTEIPAQAPYKKIGAKPMLAIVIILAAGAAFLFVPECRIFSWILLPIGLFGLLSFRNYTQFAFYPDYFLIYFPRDKDTAVKVAWQDLAMWTVQPANNGAASLDLDFKDGSQLHIPTYNWTPVQNAMLKKVGNIQKEHMRAERLESEKLVINKDAFKKLFRRFRKNKND
jgi:hypothetical protein